MSTMTRLAMCHRDQRSNLLQLDGLAAELTFVRDMPTHRLVAVFKSDGAPFNQMVHGDMAHDDRIEVTTVDTSVVAVPNHQLPVTHLYSIYDEARARSLAAVINAYGEVVAGSPTPTHSAAHSRHIVAAIDRVAIR
jgi:hypothetical protein